GGRRRRAQGDPRGASRAAQPAGPEGGERAQAPVRILGDELARLQRRPRRGAPALQRAEAELLHVPERRDWRRAARPARSRQVQVRHQRPRGLMGWLAAVLLLATPRLELADAQGAQHRLADYKGKVVLLNFWATWCEPC